MISQDLFANFLNYKAIYIYISLSPPLNLHEFEVDWLLIASEAFIEKSLMRVITGSSYFSIGISLIFEYKNSKI